MKSTLNEELIAAIKSKISQNEDIVKVLMDIFPYMGKQAVYRRIRHEVPFLFEEVVKISKKLDISIDRIMGMVDSKQAVFDYTEFESDLFTEYGESLEKYSQLMLQLQQSLDFKMRVATNTLPIILYLPYENLSRFRLYKWIYQTKNDPELSFSQIKIPPKLSAISKSTILEVNRLKSLHLIVDANLFLSFIDEIRFFYKRNLITEEEIQPLKNELYSVLDYLGELSTSGVNEGGSEVSIFLSSINIDASYTYIENTNYMLSRIRIHTIDGIETQNPNICRKQKQWIESLKKFSTMISQSGEIERINFFKKQREFISNIDNLS